MHLLLIGSRGQLGRALEDMYCASSGVRVTTGNRPQLDIANPAIAEQIAALAPDVVVNCAAWTDVDAAESNPEQAYAVNALGPHYLAEGCRRCGAMLVQVSTNEVFAGEPGRIYREYDEPQPGSVYARTKLGGERAVIQRLDRFIIARTAWLFGPGGTNFPSKITAAADKYGALRVVRDEWGNPTYAPDAAAAIAQLIDWGWSGIYHIVNQGQASRFEFAQIVLQASGRGHIPLTPISHAEWPRATQPPLHAVLANQAAAALGIQLRPWQEAVKEYLRSDK
ncbi:MAG: dTDP-4-dehydrorhamnose reductase [Chloroflexi bacterium]|nr:MAG: dTDP-4-dehydrorhamnose reductase [Chloroflexota bacterium]